MNNQNTENRSQEGYIPLWRGLGGRSSYRLPRREYLLAMALIYSALTPVSVILWNEAIRYSIENKGRLIFRLIINGFTSFNFQLERV